jgi:hypothetical protein
MVQDFTERFNAILCHARNLDNLQKVKLFVGGLPDNIRVDVAMRAPQDLPTVMYLAQAFELRANAMLAMVHAAPASAGMAGTAAATAAGPRPSSRRR